MDLVAIYDWDPILECRHEGRESKNLVIFFFLDDDVFQIQKSHFLLFGPRFPPIF